MFLLRTPEGRYELIAGVYALPESWRPMGEVTAAHAQVLWKKEGVVVYCEHVPFSARPDNQDDD